MYLSLSSILNNILFVTLPLFLYQLFFSKDSDTNFLKKDRFILIIMFSLSIILCTLFPFSFLLSEEYRFTLRQVPLIIGTLYGGYGVGFWLFIVSTLVRIPFGGDGIYISIINQLAILVMVPLLQQKYFSLSVWKRVFVCSSISGLSLVLNAIIGWVMYHDPILSVLDQWAFYIINQSIFAALAALIFEQIIKNNHLKRSLIQNERLEIVSHFSAAISHEIRNPLQVISGFTQLLKSGETTVEERQKYCNHILNEVQAAEKIISDYLLFSKPTFEKIETFNVLDEIENSIELLNTFATKASITITKQYNQQPLYIEGDRQKFKQFVINISRNCIEAMEQGGNLHFHIQPSDNLITIEISDTGKGMTKEEIARLGEPYFSTKSNGTGLGMMVVYSIIKNMNGTLTVKSKPGKGSKFIIQFPDKKTEDTSVSFKEEN